MTCPHCDSSLAVTDTAGNPWYFCGSTKTFRSISCLDREPLATKLRAATERIKLLAHELESAGVERGIAVVNEGIATNENTRLRERIAHLESWINNLDEVLRYNGKDGQREWCGSEVGYLYQGQRVYVGGDKP